MAQLETSIDPSFTFKIICMGAGGVGKTSLCQRFDKGTFSADYRLTIGTGFFIKDIVLSRNRKIKIQVWDLGGQERFMPIHGPYIMGAHAALLVFEISSIDSLQALEQWINLFHQHADPNAQICLVSTKHDLHKNDWQVTEDQIRIFMTKYSLKNYVSTSAKEDWNVSTSFQKIGASVADQYL